jgi:hypothetical protein
LRRFTIKPRLLELELEHRILIPSFGTRLPTLKQSGSSYQRGPFHIIRNRLAASQSRSPKSEHIAIGKQPLQRQLE